MSRVSDIKEEAKKQQRLLIKAKIQAALEAAKTGEELEGEENAISYYEVKSLLDDFRSLEVKDYEARVVQGYEYDEYQVVFKVDGKYVSLSADNMRMGMRDGSNFIAKVIDEFTEDDLTINNFDSEEESKEFLESIAQLRDIDLDQIFPEIESDRLTTEEIDISSEGTLDERIARSDIAIKELEAKLEAMKQERQAMINEKSAGELLNDIKEGNFVDNEDYADAYSMERNIDRLYVLEKACFKYGEEYIFPTSSVSLDDWGEDTVSAGMIMKVNGKYIVDGEWQFDSFEELVAWPGMDMLKEKDFLKVKTLKDISIQQLEDMLEGRDIGQDTRDRREKFEEALMREDVIDYFLNQSPEEIEATYGKAVAEMVGFDQNNPHHCYDLFEHTLNTVAGIDTTGLSKEDAIKLKVAAFFHDLGKPQVAMLKNGNTVFYGHAKKSAEASKEVLQMFDYKPEEIEQLQFFIEHHDDFINFKREDEEWNRNNRFLRGISLETVARKMQETKEDASIYHEYNPSKKDYELLLRLCIADANAQSRVVRDRGRVTDSRANKVDRLSQIQGLVPRAYDLSLEMTAESIKNIGKGIPQHAKSVGDKLTGKIEGSVSIFGDRRKVINVPEDIKKYEQALREVYIHDGGPVGPAVRAKIDELFASGMTEEQFSRVSKILGIELENKVIGGIEEIHKSGRLTQLFDVKKALIERNQDAEKLLQQYEERLIRQGIREDK